MSYLSGKDGASRVEPGVFKLVFIVSAFQVLLLLVSVGRGAFQSARTAVDLLSDSML